MAVTSITAALHLQITWGVWRMTEFSRKMWNTESEWYYNLFIQCLAKSIWALQNHLTLDQVTAAFLLGCKKQEGPSDYTNLIIHGEVLHMRSRAAHRYVCVRERTVLLWEVSLNWFILTELKPEGFSNFKYLYEQEYCTISIKCLWTEVVLKSMYLILSENSMSCLELVYV